MEEGSRLLSTRGKELLDRRPPLDYDPEDLCESASLPGGSSVVTHEGWMGGLGSERQRTRRSRAVVVVCGVLLCAGILFVASDRGVSSTSGKVDIGVELSAAAGAATQAAAAVPSAGAAKDIVVKAVPEPVDQSSKNSARQVDKTASVEPKLANTDKAAEEGKVAAPHIVTVEAEPVPSAQQQAPKAATVPRSAEPSEVKVAALQAPSAASAQQEKAQSAGAAQAVQPEEASVQQHPLAQAPQAVPQAQEVPYSQPGYPQQMYQQPEYAQAPYNAGPFPQYQQQYAAAPQEYVPRYAAPYPQQQLQQPYAAAPFGMQNGSPQQQYAQAQPPYMQQYAAPPQYAQQPYTQYATAPMQQQYAQQLGAAAPNANANAGPGAAPQFTTQLGAAPNNNAGQEAAPFSGAGRDNTPQAPQAQGLPKLGAEEKKLLQEAHSEHIMASEAKALENPVAPLPALSLPDPGKAPSVPVQPLPAAMPEPPVGAGPSLAPQQGPGVEGAQQQQQQPALQQPVVPPTAQQSATASLPASGPILVDGARADTDSLNQQAQQEASASLLGALGADTPMQVAQRQHLAQEMLQKEMAASGTQPAGALASVEHVQDLRAIDGAPDREGLLPDAVDRSRMEEEVAPDGEDAVDRSRSEAPAVARVDVPEDAVDRSRTVAPEDASENVPEDAADRSTSDRPGRQKAVDDDADEDEDDSAGVHEARAMGNPHMDKFFGF